MVEPTVTSLDRELAERLSTQGWDAIAEALAGRYEEGRQSAFKEAENRCDELAAEYGSTHLYKAANEIAKLASGEVGALKLNGAES